MQSMSLNRLLAMGLLHFLIMYFLMFSMVHSRSNVLPSLNQAYMAAIMTAPMLALEALLMGSMYKSKLGLKAILWGSIFAFVLFFLFIRNQTLIKDKEFLLSMIPHHSGAILMCEQSDLTDPEIKQLCTQIIESQQEEIDIMQEKLRDF
jgi:uncharacterized protein (DUF305 family)